ncbi:hypothetical protein Hdeb2414_s0009g00306681 [Helianthus debilis subsp. tardiflorus]
MHHNAPSILLILHVTQPTRGKTHKRPRKKISLTLRLHLQKDLLRFLRLA